SARSGDRPAVADLVAELPDWYPSELRGSLAQWVLAESIRKGPPGMTANAEDSIALRTAHNLEAGLTKSLPDWVPHLLRRAAARLSVEALARAQDGARLARLAADPRMRPVWVELQKRCRSDDGRYFYGTPQWTADETEDQLYAMIALFNAAVWFYRHPLPTM